MLSKIDFQNDHVTAYKWDGKFDEKAFYQSLSEFLPEMKRRDKFNIYMELHSIDGVEPKAVWQDLKFGLENMKEITEKVDKVALVTDKNWVQKLAEISYTFVPGIELKSFAFEKSPEAKKWVVD